MVRYLTFYIKVNIAYRTKAFRKRVLREIFEPNSEEVTGVWKILYNEELHDWYSS